jgi:phosphate-selective porin
MIKATLGFICVVLLSLATTASAQTSTGTTATSAAPASAETTGTIKEYTPGSLLVLETLAPNAPIQFKLSKNITYADSDGKVIEAAGLTTNQKVRVHYTKIGGDNLADKVTLIGN